MLEMLRKKLIDAGIDPTVGSMDYWGTELEGVLLDMYDLGSAEKREEPWYKYVSDEMLMAELKIRNLNKDSK